MGKQKEQIVDLCGNCICPDHFHLGDSVGICINCKCDEFVQDDAMDLFGRLGGFDVPEHEVPKQSTFIEDLIGCDVAIPELPANMTAELFIGRVSRGCQLCGETKLYKEFNGSINPETLCNYCSWEESEMEMLEAMTDKEREDIIEMEEAILENELAYDEAIERQEMIDMVLRGLDE